MIMSLLQLTNISSKKESKYLEVSAVPPLHMVPDSQSRKAQCNFYAFLVLRTVPETRVLYTVA